MSDQVVVTGAARTPFGRFGGTLRELSLPELGRIAARGAMSRAGLHPSDVDELVMGVNLPGADRSVARQTALRAGVPDDRVAITVDRACCSSLTALTLARRTILAGDAQVVLAGGAENLSLVPYFLTGMRFGVGLGDVTMTDQLVVSCPHTGVPRAVQAADEAAEYGVTRADQDEWALRSQQRYATALAQGLFADELVPVTATCGRTMAAVDRDESPRPDTTLERLAALPTVYGSGTVTAGNAPGLSTGSAFLALSSRARAHESPVLATILATAQVSGHPAKITSIPARAASVALDRAGLRMADVDLIEVNEAFAAVPLVTTQLLAGGEQEALALRERTNVNGGAIAIGHPTGSTGARLVMTISHELRRRGGGVGLVTMCGGVGEGEAVVVRVDAEGA